MRLDEFEPIIKVGDWEMIYAKQKIHSDPFEMFFQDDFEQRYNENHLEHLYYREECGAHELTSELQHISDVITQAEELITFSESYYDGDFVPITQDLLSKAIGFIKSYSNYLHEIYGKVLIAPEITPLKDGSIDVHWQSGEGCLLVNFKNTNNDIAFYYGETNAGEMDFNGQIKIGTANPQFAAWLTNL